VGGLEDRAPGSGKIPLPSLAKPALDDSELLRALRADEVGAATAFHDRVRRQVDRTIFRLLGRRDVDHDDLAQLAMIELIGTIDRFRGDCSLDAWTSTVTAHVVYKHLRRRKTERRIFSGPTQDEMPIPTATSPTRSVAMRSAVARVLLHLDEMDEQRAWTYVLHDVCGYDLREIAEITGVTIAAAQTRLVRGRKELHQRIAQDPELGRVLAEEGVIG
jgi:RNA polymerase sigma-70 factor (ECF subfamily)